MHILSPTSRLLPPVSCLLLLRVVSIALVLFLSAAACGATTSTISQGITDAQIAARVTTVLLNDAALGLQPIELRVDGGVVFLTGRVRTAEDRDRALALARSVSGVADVRDELTIGAIGSFAEPPGRNPGLPAIPQPRSATRLLALGMSTAVIDPTDDGLARDVVVGPFVRLSPRRGVRPAIGFGWFGTTIVTGPSGKPGLAVLRIKPVMGGIEYTVSDAPVAVSLSVVGGYSFNSMDLDSDTAGPHRAIATSDSLAWRGGVSAWFDLAPRLGLNLFGGVLMTRPQVTFANDAVIEQTHVPITAPIVSVGIGYWVF
jgi:hyperosmotically inducible protein